MGNWRIYPIQNINIIKIEKVTENMGHWPIKWVYQESTDQTVWSRPDRGIEWIKKWMVPNMDSTESERFLKWTDPKIDSSEIGKSQNWTDLKEDCCESWKSQTWTVSEVDDPQSGRSQKWTGLRVNGSNSERSQKLTVPKMNGFEVDDRALHCAFFFFKRKFKFLFDNLL